MAEFGTEAEILSWRRFWGFGHRHRKSDTRYRRTSSQKQKHLNEYALCMVPFNKGRFLLLLYSYGKPYGTLGSHGLQYGPRKPKPQYEQVVDFLAPHPYVCDRDIQFLKGLPSVLEKQLETKCGYANIRKYGTSPIIPQSAVGFGIRLTAPTDISGAL